MDKRIARQAAVDKLRRKARHFSATFRSENGKKVLESLHKEFNGDNMIGSEPHATYYKLGQRDVVIYLEQMIRAAEKDNE